MDEDALAAFDPGGVMEHTVGGGSVEDEGDSWFWIDFAGNLDEKFLREVDELGVAFVFRETDDLIANGETAAPWAVEADAAQYAVAKG